MSAGEFKLYPEEKHWWSFNDHRFVLQAIRRIGAKRVLEFGPGSSTLALIEGGATSIDCCEDSPDWAQVYEERLAARFPGVVRIHRYQWSEPVTIPALDDQRFDMALIDGPLGTRHRPDALRYALPRCRWVVMPTEEYHTAAWLRGAIAAIAAHAGVPCSFHEVGPLSGAFAIVGPAC